MTQRDNRQVNRIRLEEPLTVEMQSIGAGVTYDLKTRDVSNSGFFLDFEKPGRFPFTESSILEVWMNLGSKKIFFNGKMVRVVFPNDDEAKKTGPGIAIRIVQIGTEEQASLVEFITACIAGKHAGASAVAAEEGDVV